MWLQQNQDCLFLMGVVICLSGVCYGAGRNEACGNGNTCIDGTTCDNGTCVCDLTTHFYLSGACSTKLFLGTQCPSGYTSADGSVCTDVNAECGDGGTGIDCVCKDTHYNNGGTCTLKYSISLGDSCPTFETSTTNNYCSDANARCDGATCQCMNGYFQIGSQCLAEGSVAVGGTCPSVETSTTTYCSDANARCNGATCQCMNGYFQMGTQCFQERSVALGDACPSDETSTTNTYCSDDNARCDGVTCQCITGYFEMYSVCFAERSLLYETSCPIDESVSAVASIYCMENNVICLSGGSGLKCLCRSQYFRNGNTCTLGGTLSYGATCPSAETNGQEASKYCSGTHVKCLPVYDGATTNSCQCRTGYFWNVNSCAAVNSVAVGGACPSVETTTNTYCSDDNARCTIVSGSSYTCQCRNGYFTMGSVCHQEMSVSLGGACPQVESDSTTYCMDSNALCTGSTGSTACQCKTGFFEMNSACVPECPTLESGEQLYFCSIDNLICLQSGNTLTCQCANGYFENGGICILESTLAYDASCPADESGSAGFSVYCTENNVMCLSDGGSGLKCLCRTGYFRNGNTCTLGGTLLYGATCPGIETNGPDSSQYCSGTHVKCLHVYDGATTYICQCRTGYFWNGNSCAAVNSVAVGDYCPSVETTTNTYCSDDNARCTLVTGSSYTCQCRSGYFTMGIACHQEKSVLLGAGCPQAESDTTTYCRDDNALCTETTAGPITCQCKTGFFQMNSACVPDNSIQLNQTCPSQETGEQSVFCRIDKSICLQSGTAFTCQCANGYFENGGVCVPDRSVPLGGSCPLAEIVSTTFCQDINARCTPTSGGSAFTCQCKYTHFRDGTVCVTKNVLPIGEACPVVEVNTNIYCSDNNAICTDTGGTTTCQCRDSHFVFGTTCVSDNSIILNERCPGFESPGSFTEYCQDLNARCSGMNPNPTCVCMTGYFVHNDGCVQDRSLVLGATCPVLEQATSTTYCSDPDARCSGSSYQYTCMCLSTHYDSNTAETQGGTCEAKVELGEPCPQLDACGTIDSVCTSGTCRCVTTHYDNNGPYVTGGQCVLSQKLGHSCSNDNECSALNSVCSGGTCKCHHNFFTILPNTCEKRNLGETCQRTTQCAASHSECLDVCQCSLDYYPSSSTSCEKRGIGETCDHSTQCLPANSECRYAGTSQMCACQAGYLQTSLSSCEIVSAPETPSGFALSSISDSSVTLTWTPGYNGGLPQTFTLQYRPKDVIEWRSINQISGNKTSYNVESLRSGIKYVCMMYSQNDIGRSSPTPEVEFTTKQLQLDSNTSNASVAMVGGILGSVALIAIVIAVVLLVILLRQRAGPKRNVESDTAAASTEASSYEVMSSIQNKTEKPTAMNSLSLQSQETALTYSGLTQYGNLQNTYEELDSA